MSKDLNKNFGRSIRDLIWLLDRGYPKKGSIELVGNRYGLDREERLMLYRGVFDTETCKVRSKKKIGLDDFRKATKVFIDCYNLMITIRSYLQGRVVFRGLDGYVRDTAGVYGNFSYDAMSSRVLGIIIQNLEQIHDRRLDSMSICFYLDSPVSRSRELAGDISRMKLGRFGIIRAVLSRNPDMEMLEEHRNWGGIIVSSDTVVIDGAEKVFDLADWIISHSFKSKIFDLKQFSKETV